MERAVGVQLPDHCLCRGVSLQEKGEPKEHLIYFLSL